MPTCAVSLAQPLSTSWPWIIDKHSDGKPICVSMLQAIQATQAGIMNNNNSNN